MTPAGESDAGLGEGAGFFTAGAGAAEGLAIGRVTTGDAGTFRVSAEAGWRTSPARIADDRRRSFTAKA